MTAKQALSSIDESLRRYVRDDELFVSDVPGVEVVVDGVDPRALLLLDGLNTGNGGPPTARVFVYQRNVERLAGALELVEGEIKTALEREINATFVETDLDRLAGGTPVLN